MPKQVLPTTEDFRLLRDLLVGRYAFQEITFKNLKRSSPNPNRFLAPPRRREPGEETGFRFSANGYHVVVWTTWITCENSARELDTGWVLITDEDGKAEYFAQPIHRTKNFVKHLVNRAWIARWRVLNRPKCPECGTFMCITDGMNLKSRYWRCNNRLQHQKDRSIGVDWDRGLPPRAKRYIAALRKQRRKHRDKLRAQGKPGFQAMLRRKRWRMHPLTPRR